MQPNQPVIDEWEEFQFRRFLEEEAARRPTDEGDTHE